MKATTIAATIKILEVEPFNFLIVKSIAKLTPRSRPAARTKSNKDQFTSCVNCMAVKGTRKTRATMPKMMWVLLKTNIMP